MSPSRCAVPLSSMPDLVERSLAVMPLDALLKHVFAGMQEAVVVTDASRHIILTNDSAEALFGFAAGEMIGRSTLDLYASQKGYEDQGRARYNLAAQARQETYTAHYRRRDGSLFEGETIGGPVRDPRSDTIMYLGIIRDVSAREESARTLNRLHRITSDRTLDFDARLKAILKLGCDHYGLPVGVFSRIEDNRYCVVQAVHPKDEITPGTVLPLGDTYCKHTLAADGPVGFHHVGKSDIANQACYVKFGFEAYLGTPVSRDGVLYGTLNFCSSTPTRQFTSADLELIRLFAEWVGHELAREADMQELRAIQARLERAAAVDELTGLANRRRLLETLVSEIDRGYRYGYPLSVALIDFDYFKALNDNHGHDAGDAALVLFAQLARENIRAVDLAGRWGGEEFLLLFPNTGQDGALIIANRVAEAVRRAGFTVGETSVPLSVSIGVATSVTDDTPETVIKRADLALYTAKAAGRDCVRGN